MLPGVTQKDSELIPGIMRHLWVFLAYVAAARLAILLALPPGYASPIWPAAGIAMAAIIVWGPSLTIAVFLGSLATNLRPDELMLHPMNQILLQLCLAWGTSIQAYVGSLLYHALVKRLPNQASPSRLALEVFLLGPLTCLTAATISSAALTFFRVSDPPSFISNWIWWWMGDSFGAGVLGPILLRLHSHLHPKQLRAKIAPYLIAPAGLSLLIVISLIFYLSQNNSQSRQNLKQAVADFHQRLQQDIEQAQQDLQVLTEFSRHTDPLSIIERYPSSAHKGRHIIWVPRVTLEDRPGFEKSFGNVQRHFTILEKNSNADLVPAGIRPVYWPMIFKNSHDFNPLPTGFDLGSLPKIQQFLKTASESSETGTSPLLTIGQNKKAVFLVKKGLNSQANAFKQGLFITIIVIDAFIKPALPKLNHNAVHIHIKSPGAPEAIYQSWFGTDTTETIVNPVLLYENYQNTLTIGAQTLLVEVGFPAKAIHSARMGDSIFTTMLGILLAFILNVLLISQQNRPNEASHQVTVPHDQLFMHQEMLHDTDRSKVDLLANFSHQIKSPPWPATRSATPSSANQWREEVLVVDDNVINLTVASSLLVKMGYLVDTAAGGREALDKVKRKAYDLIFMDCHMPHMDGYETTQHIRNTCRPGRGPLIIALTANALDDARIRANEAGMDKIMTKPISLDALIKTVGYAKKMTNSLSPLAAPIMDVEAFSLGLGDDHDLMKTAVIRYFEEIDGMMDRLRAEVEAGDLASTAKIAHTLKGMTSLFAAHDLVEANRNLETAARHGHTHEFLRLFKRIESLTELLKIELRTILHQKNLNKKDIA